MVWMAECKSKGEAKRGTKTCGRVKMEPIRDTKATLVDLLDRILDKGIMLDADLMITMAGIPLIGIKLKAAIAGIETMLEYGIWKDWDEAQRAYAAEEWRRKEKRVPLLEGEEVILKMFGSHWYSKGIYRNWRPGRLYVTTERVFLHRKEPAEILFEASYENIEGFAIERKRSITKKETNYLYLFLNSGEVAWLHPTEAYPVKEAIQGRMKELGLRFNEKEVPMIDEDAAKFLMEDEEIVHSEKMWYLLEHPAPGGETTKTWKSGKLYLTSKKRICWWYDFDECVAFECGLGEIIDVGVETKDFGGMLKEKRVLVLITENGNEPAYFSGDEEAMRAIEKGVKKRMKMSTVAEEEETETCPSCGRRAPVMELLNEGCKGCGWVSPRLKLKKKEILAHQ